MRPQNAWGTLPARLRRTAVPRPARRAGAATRSPESRKPTVLQAKFGSWLSWSQPFVHRLVVGLDAHARNIVLCNRTENMHRFPVREICRVPTRYLIDPLRALRTAQGLRRFQPDVMHAHFGWSGLRLLLLKQILRIPLVVTFGGRDVGMQVHMPEFAPLYETLFRLSDQVICVSQDLARRAEAVGVEPERIRVVYRGTDLSSFRFVDRSDRAGGRTRLLMVGRLTDKKGHRYALEAVARLVRAGHDLELYVVGEGDGLGPLKAQVRQLGIGQVVEFTGSTNAAGVRQHMEAADILVHCSVTSKDGDVEGIPNVVVEGQATGLPVIGTLHGGIPECVHADRTGLLVPEADGEALERAIATLIEDRPRRLDLGKAARVLMTEQFDLQTQIRTHAEIYQELIETCRAASDWAERCLLPENYLDIVHPLRGITNNPEEFSLAELVEELTSDWTEPDPADAAVQIVEFPDSTKVVERVYDLKRFVPSLVKFPVKRWLGLWLVRAVELKLAQSYGSWGGTRPELNQAILDYFRGGGDMPIGNDAANHVVEKITDDGIAS